MFDVPSTIAAGGVSMALLELAKWLIRQFTGKPVDFPPVVYAVEPYLVARRDQNG